MVYEQAESTEIIPVTVPSVVQPDTGLGSASLKDMQALFRGSQYINGVSDLIPQFSISGAEGQASGAGSTIADSRAMRATVDRSVSAAGDDRVNTTDVRPARPGEAALSEPERRILNNLSSAMSSNDIARMRQALNDFSQNIHALTPDQVARTSEALSRRVEEAHPGVSIYISLADQPSGEYAINHDLVQARMIYNPGGERQWILDLDSNGVSSAQERSGPLRDTIRPLSTSHTFSRMTTGGTDSIYSSR